MGVVGGGQHLGLVDVVHAHALQDLGLDEVADAGLGHHRDRDGVHDAVDEVGVTHPCHATLRTDVGGHAFQRHHGDCAGAFGDAGLLGGDDVHDHAALEHLGHAALDPRGSGLSSAVHYGLSSTGSCPSLVVGHQRFSGRAQRRV